MDRERLSPPDERNGSDIAWARERGEGGHDDFGYSGAEKSSKHRSEDHRKSSRGEEKDHRSKDRERSKRSSDDVSKEKEKEVKDSERDRVRSREKRKEDRDEHEKERSRSSKVKDKDYDRDYKEKEYERERDRKDRVKDRERERERELEKDNVRGQDKERGKEKDRDRDRDRDRERDRDRKKKDKDKDRSNENEREKGREKHRDQEEKESYRNLDKDRGKERILEDDRKTDQNKEKSQDKEGIGSKNDEERIGWIADEGKDYMLESDGENNRDRDVDQGNMVQHLGGEENFDGLKVGAHASSTMLEERVRNMKEERLKKQTEESEVLAWVKRSRKLEEKKLSEKEKALQLSKIFEEQDNVDQSVSDDDIAPQDRTSNHNLAGVKVLHGVDKVLEGGAVVLTLKDQSILADGDVNEELDVLENVEIGEQKQRDMAYKSAKKKTGIYDDKFNDESYGEKKMLPQYDDPADADEGLTLDGRGGFNNDAEKKLEELRRRLQGASSVKHFEDLDASTKVSRDYYTQDEMLKFKKPKKKKSLRKKEKLDIAALEAEAISAGLGAGDLGSRNGSRRQARKEEQEKSEAETRHNAYQSAYAKADEASRSLQIVQTSSTRLEDNDDTLIADDDEDFYKSLERARKLALKKQDAASGPGAIARLVTEKTSSQTTDDQNSKAGESQENKVVLTEMEEFVWGLQLDEDAHKPEEEDVFMDDDDEVPKEEYHEDVKDKDGGWTEVKDTAKEEPTPEESDAIAPDETIHEVPVGKGLSSALKLLKDRGTLKESIEWGGRNMDKRKSKLVGIVDEDEPKDSKSKDSRLSSLVDYKKEIHIERTDEFGRIMTPKESFRQLSHKFHGKGPGKMKQEKRMKQYQEELKLKQMKNADTPSLSVERMREAQAQLKTPYLVLSGHVKPGQTSDPRSGFATVEKDLPGGLTPMLGDRKVEHFLGIKRKGEASNTGTKKAKI